MILPNKSHWLPWSAAQEDRVHDLNSPTLLSLLPPHTGGCVQAPGWADWCLGLLEENIPSNIMETNSTLESFGLCFQTNLEKHSATMATHSITCSPVYKGRKSTELTTLEYIPIYRIFGIWSNRKRPAVRSGSLFLSQSLWMYIVHGNV